MATGWDNWEENLKKQYALMGANATAGNQANLTDQGGDFAAANAGWTPTASAQAAVPNWNTPSPSPAPAPQYTNPTARAVSTATAPSTGGFTSGGSTPGTSAAPAMAPAPAPQGITDAEIKSYFEANKGDPNAIVNAANQYGIGLGRIQQATGYSSQEAADYLKWGNIMQGPDGKFSVSAPAPAPFAGAWKDFNFQEAMKTPADLQNGGARLVNGMWVHPAAYGNARQVGEGEASTMEYGDPTEYWVTKDLGKGNAGIIGGGGSSIYENNPYDRYDAQGNYLGSNNYKDMGTDGFTKAMGYASLIAALGGTAATALGAGGAALPAAAETAAAGTAPGATAGGVTVGGPMSVGLPAGSALPSAAAAATTAGATTGGLAGIKAAVASALAPLGMSAKDIASVVGLVAAATGGGGGDMPQYGGGGGGGGGVTGATTGSSQGAEAKAFLDQVLPALRPNASNPYGSAQWTKDANGNWKLDTRLNSANQGLFDTSTNSLQQLLAGIDPKAKAPALIDSVRGDYSDALAKTIYNRTMGAQGDAIDAERRRMQARLAEQGFVPGNEGYEREMHRWEQSLGEMSNKAAMDAQIQAAKQSLDEANFTNTSRTQGFTNSQNLQQQLAQILAGARTNATGGLSSLTTQAQAPTGSPGNVQSSLDSKYRADLASYEADQAQRNDMIRAILGLFA